MPISASAPSGCFALTCAADRAIDRRRCLVKQLCPEDKLAFLFGAGAAVLDLQEVLTQLGRGNSLVAGVAGLVAVAHVAVAVLTVVAWAALRAARG